MAVKRWRKMGHSRILSESHGRSLGSQEFINPINGALEEFSFFYCKVNSVIVLPITTDKKIVIIRQFRHAMGRVFIELPGGNKNKNETSIKAAKRELLEETGFSPKKITELKTKKIWVDPSAYKNFYIPCLATDCYKISEPKLDPTECVETMAIPINEWLEMIHDGLVTDCKTLAVTLLALPYIGIEIKK